MRKARYRMVVIFLATVLDFNGGRAVLAEDFQRLSPASL